MVLYGLGRGPHDQELQESTVDDIGGDQEFQEATFDGNSVTKQPNGTVRLVAIYHVWDGLRRIQGVRGVALRYIRDE